MHGTFRGRIENRAGLTVQFDARASHPPPKPRRWRAKVAALLAGGCVAALPIASQPTWNAGKHPPARTKRAAPRAEVAVAGDFIANPVAALAVPALPPPAMKHRTPAASARSPETAATGDSIADPAAAQTAPVLPPPATSPLALVPPPLSPVTAVAASDIETAEIAPALAPPAMPTFAIAPLAAPPITVSLPDPPAHFAAAASVAAPLGGEAAGAPPAEALRPVDVPQLADSEVWSLRVPQLHEPGVVAGGGATLAAKVAAMQVTPPPPVRLRDADRAALLAEAPTRMILRIGGSALGKVEFRMTDARTIDVKLSGLLDLLAGHYDAAEFARLRGSTAADAYVSFDQLRALGLNVRYDPAYDELAISG